MNKHHNSKIPQKNALVIGATGLVGSYLVQELQDCGYYQHVFCIVRKIPENKVQGCQYIVLADFNDMKSCLEQLNKEQINNAQLNKEQKKLKAVSKHTDVFSCLGTTQKIAGSKSAFYDVDFGINYTYAQVCHNFKVENFYLLSSAGANARSKTSFYLKTKGQLEDAIAELNFKNFNVFRPSLLIGHHEDRLLENMGQTVFKWVKKIYPKYSNTRPIEAQRVAKAMRLVATDETIYFIAEDSSRNNQITQKSMKVMNNTAMLKNTI